MNSIPMSSVIGTIPGVLSAGGNPLSLNGAYFTKDKSLPIGQALPFVVGQASTWFGPQSPEAILSGFYFNSFLGADARPSTLWFMQYNDTDVSAYLRGGSLASVSLTALQGFSGTLSVVVDGRTVLSPAAINLASATSFSNAAALMQAGLQATGNVWSGTLTVTNASPTVTINSTVSGILHVGDVLVGADIPAGATITAFGTYTVLAGTGTVTISTPATGALGPETGTVTELPTVTYDSLRTAFVVTSPTTGNASTIGYAGGTLAPHVFLTQLTGAVISAGANATTPAAACNALVNSTQNWATFSTVFEADAQTALGFAAWVSTASPAGQERFLYVEWDSVTANDTNPQSSVSFGAQAQALAYNGVCPMYDLQAGAKSAFAMGFCASLDFDAPNGSATLAFKGQSGLTADVTDLPTAVALGGPLDGSGGFGNSYNYYGSFATPNQAFQWMQRGTVTGAWKWLQPYINQIAMNADFQLALANLESVMKSIPYNTAGTNTVRGSLSGTIQKYVTFGAIRPNIQLSSTQAQAVNAAAGVKIDSILSTVGYYLQILPASPTVRGLRGSPPMKFWYTDGGSIQSLFLGTTDVQ